MFHYLSKLGYNIYNTYSESMLDQDEILEQEIEVSDYLLTKFSFLLFVTILKPHIEVMMRSL